MRPPRRANHRELVPVRPIPAEPQHRPRRCPQRDARRASGVSARRRERTRRRCGTRSRDAQAHSEREKQPWLDGSHPPEITTPTGKHVPVPQRCLTKRRSVPMRESSALEACVSGTRCSGSTSSRAPALKPACCRACHIRRPVYGPPGIGPGPLPARGASGSSARNASLPNAVRTTWPLADLISMRAIPLPGSTRPVTRTM